MTTNQESQTAKQPIMTPPPATIDLESVRIQVLFGLLGLLIVCVVNYLPILNFGYLSDRVQPFKEVADAFHGNWHGLINGWSENWANTPNQHSSPSFVVSLTYLSDFAIWHLHAIGYCLTNILVYFLSAMFVVLISLELSGLRGNRMGASTALWAGFLYALHPLHTACVPFIYAREHIVGTLFYLAAVFFFLRFQLLRERQYLLFSVFCSVLTLSLDESAMTLPVVLGLASLLLTPLSPNRPPRQAIREGIAMRARQLVMDTWPFWTILGILAATGKLNIELSLGRDLQAVAFAVLNFASIVVSYPHILSGVLISCTCALALLGTVRACRGNINWCPYLFLVLWAVAEILGPRQGFFGGSLFITLAPFCILLASLAFPGLDTRGLKNTRAWAAFGCALLAALCVSWSYSLQLDLGEVMRSMLTQ
jgi:hypothetical protein